MQSNEFADYHIGRFSICTELEGISNDIILLADLDSVLPEGSIRELDPTGRHRMVILVTEEAHCLGDLLVRVSCGGLDIDVATVIDNHDTLCPLVERFGIPLKLISHEGLGREEYDKRVRDTVVAHKSGYVILTKYVRILTPEFVTRLPSKITNTHHLPSSASIGARPYHQAYECGVKIIGAATRYVNDNLDKGLTVMQDVIHVDHVYTTEDVMHTGRDVRKSILGRALYQVLTQRIFVYGDRTIIL